MNGRSGCTSLSMLMRPMASSAIAVIRFQPGWPRYGSLRGGVAEQVVGLPLAGIVADETVVVVEALEGTGRPVMEGPGLARFPLRHVVILAEPRGVVAVLSEN